MSHPRVYKKGWTEAQALEHLKSQSGIRFDPDILEIFLTNYEDIKAAAKEELLINAH